MVPVDSFFVKRRIDEKFVARENRALAILLCHMWKVTKKKLQLYIRLVHGHTGAVGNSIADELADLGTRLWKHSIVVEASSSNVGLGGRRLPCKGIESAKKKSTV